jgi:hypothetical protein
MWKKRGRPSSIDIKTDKGTRELQKKREQHMTVEPLDLCLKNRIITPLEHASGIKLRWIYTLRFGAPTVQSKSLQTNLHTNREYDEEFLQNIQRKYRTIIETLKQARAHKVVMNICIFNESPQFLTLQKFDDPQKEKFVQGMELLSKEFNNSKADNQNHQNSRNFIEKPKISLTF